MTPHERRRLAHGPDPGEQPGGIGTIDVIAWCDDPDDVAARAREVLVSLPELPEGASDTPERWRPLLPEWFTAQCQPEAQGADSDGDTGALGVWRLSAWLYAFEPEERSWWWWDAVAEPGAGRLQVVVVVDDWPVAVGSLVWLLTAAGAKDVDILA
jgi:hypothetical protein